jgi:hypothetical protein
LAGAVTFSLVGFSLIGFSLTGFSPVLGFYLTGAVSSIERFISLTGIVQKRPGCIDIFIFADHSLEEVFIILSFAMCWIHSICKLRIASYYNANNQM